MEEIERLSYEVAGFEVGCEEGYLLIGSKPVTKTWILARHERYMEKLTAIKKIELYLSDQPAFPQLWAAYWYSSMYSC